MKKLFGVFILSLFLIGFVVAINSDFPSIFGEENEIDLNALGCVTLSSYKSEFVGTEIPNRIPCGNEIFNIYISEDFFGSLKIVEHKIQDFVCKENENNTYDIFIKDYSTILGAIESGDKMNYFSEKLNKGEIEIKGVTFGKKFKLFFTKIGLKIANWFS